MAMIIMLIAEPPDHGKFFADEIQSESPFILADLAFYGISLAQVISRLSLHLRYKLLIVLGAAKARAAQAFPQVPTENPLQTFHALISAQTPSGGGG
jgi:hypothetical protein